jgi:hypothetical protein
VDIAKATAITANLEIIASSLPDPRNPILMVKHLQVTMPKGHIGITSETIAERKGFRDYGSVLSVQSDYSAGESHEVDDTQGRRDLRRHGNQLLRLR